MADAALATRPLDTLADFPAIPAGWAYLDTAATAQKPQPVIDAITRGYDTEYATVHRGVYRRSADMTLAYEAARTRVADFIGAAANEIVFVRGATEAINLVATCWVGTQLKAGDRILLSRLEHHSNIVPWQMVAERVGAAIDVVPLTGDQCIDLDAMERMIRPEHKLVALAHVSNVLGSVLDAKRAAGIAHSVGAKLLLDGCQAVPRLPVDVADLDCDFYVFSGHKLYGPTGIGVLWGQGGPARRDAAVSGRRIDDRQGHVRAHHLRPAARTVRGRGRRISSARWASMRRSITSRASGWSASTRTKPRSSARRARRSARSIRSACSGPTTAPGSSVSRSTGCIRTISAPSWTKRRSRSAPAITARSR